MTRRAKGEGSLQHIVPLKCKKCKDFAVCQKRLDPNGKCYRRDCRERWRYEYSVRGIDGKIKRMAVEAKTHKEIDAKIEKIKLKNANGANDTVTVGQWCDRWCNVVLPGTVKGSTLKNYKFLLSYLPEDFLKKKLSRLTPIVVQEMITDLSTHGAKADGRGLSSKTVRNIRTTFISCIQSAIDNGLIFTNPVKKTKPPRNDDQREITVLTQDQIVKLLEVADSGVYYYKEPMGDDVSDYLIKQWAMVIRLTLSTGMRRGEVFGLTWGAVDFKDKTISIKTNLESGKLQTPKTKSSIRTIPVDNDTMERLKSWKESQKQFAFEMDDLFHNKLNTVFTGLYGGPVHFDNFRNRIFNRMVATAGLPDTIHMHSLRHTVATQLLAAGHDAKTVSKRLGHSSEVFTLHTYVHTVEEIERKAADTMGAIMAGKKTI